EIFIKYLKDIIDKFEKEVDTSSMQLGERTTLINSFIYFRNYRKFVLSVIKSNMTHILLDGLNNYILQKTKKVGSHFSPIKLYAYSGALFNIYLEWIKNEKIGTIEEIVDAITVKDRLSFR
ncbi:MAG: hypothetical protein ACRC5M_04205, partial [Anaeroplasmataceae bacterium]